MTLFHYNPHFPEEIIMNHGGIKMVTSYYLELTKKAKNFKTNNYVVNEKMRSISKILVFECQD